MPLNRKQRRLKEAKARKANRIEAAKRVASKSFTLGGPCKIQAAEGEGKLGTFTGNAYTGAQMRPSGWCGDLIVDLAGVKVNSQNQPVLRQHDHEQLVGHTTAITVDPKEGVLVKGVFSGEQQHVDKVVVPGKNDFPWQLSIGADPVRTEYLEAGKEAVVNGRTVKGPIDISRETKLGEISFVPLGADDQTSATIAAQANKGETMNPFKLALKSEMAKLRAAGETKAAKHTDDEVDAMSDEEARAALKECMVDAAADDDEDEDEDEEDDKPKKKKSKSAKAKPAIAATSAKEFLAEMRKEAVAETQRHRAITAACRKHGVDTVTIEAAGKQTVVNLAEHAIAQEWNLDQVKSFILEQVRADRPAGIVGGLGYSPGQTQVSEAVLECAILQAARHQFRLEDDSFYSDPTPDGKSSMRRVSERMQREAQGGLKARYTDQVQQAAHTMFQGRISPHQLFRAAFAATGINLDMDMRSESGWKRILGTWGHAENQILAGGASNLSIGNILSNVLNKFALQGYLYVEQAWRDIAAIRPVSDFKPTKSINLLGDTKYLQLGPTGQLQDASLGDQAFSNRADPYGRILTIPWTHLVNDDLGMLTGAPMKIGQGAGLALNDFFWALWASLASGSAVGIIPSAMSLLGDDGLAFFRTTSSNTPAARRAGTAYLPNKDTGAALSSATLKTGKALFDNQIDPNGNPLGFDGAMPILLFGPSNWNTATELLTYRELVFAGNTGGPLKQAQGNVWAGKMKPVMSKYIENANYGNSTTAFWIIFDPVALAAIEVCFLNGVDTPAVLQAGPDYQFDKLGISIRGTMPFGVNQQQFRGAVYNAGA